MTQQGFCFLVAMGLRCFLVSGFRLGEGLVLPGLREIELLL